MAQIPFAPSFDPLDTRPNTSGVVPPVHYNYAPGTNLAAPGLPFRQAIGTALKAYENMLTMGATAHPAAAESYWKGVANSFNPWTNSGALNDAALLSGSTTEPMTINPARAPSFGSTSKLTPAQQGFVNLLRYNPYGHTGVYNPNDPGVQALAGKLGTPYRNVMTAAPGGGQIAPNPYNAIRGDWELSPWMAYQQILRSGLSQDWTRYNPRLFEGLPLETQRDLEVLGMAPTPPAERADDYFLRTNPTGYVTRGLQAEILRQILVQQLRNRGS